jgi:hypothetical protein
MVALAILSTSIFAVIWLAGGRERKVSEPPSRFGAQTPATESLPPKKIAREISAGCIPLADGAFSCGACRDDADCPPSTGCIINLETGRTECEKSQCTKSAECAGGTLCRVVGKTSRGDTLRACVPPGTRSGGAACDPNNGGDPSVSCAANLLCVDGGCAPSCRPTEIDEPSDCPNELPCVETESGWGCTPSCKYQQCGGGKTCSFLSVEGPIALCTHAIGANCLGSKGGCPASHDCIVETDVRAERTTFSCVARCTPSTTDNSCPKGLMCVPGKAGGHCRRACAPSGESQCGSNERCTRADATGDLWFCSAT